MEIIENGRLHFLPTTTKGDCLDKTFFVFVEKLFMESLSLFIRKILTVLIFCFFLSNVIGEENKKKPEKERPSPSPSPETQLEKIEEGASAPEVPPTAEAETALEQEPTTDSAFGEEVFESIPGEDGEDSPPTAVLLDEETDAEVLSGIEEVDLIPLPDDMTGDVDLLDLPDLDDGQLLIPDDLPPLEVIPALPVVAIGETARAIDARYNKIRIQMEKEADLVSLREQADRADTFEQSRAAMREYYRLLFNKIREVDPSLTRKCNALEEVYINRLSQNQIEPSIPLEPPPKPEPIE